MQQSRRIYDADRVLANMQSARDLTTTLGPEAAIRSLIEYLPFGFLVVSQTGTVLAANGAAKRTLEAAELLSERNGTITVSATPAGKRIRELIRSAKEGKQAALRIARPGAKPILAVGSPLFNSEGPGAALAAAVIFVADDQPQRAINPALLAGLFGFTPAESKVAVQMMQGQTVEDIATTLGISQHTTRNHLKRLYAKTGTRKQCEFVHAMLTSPARFAIALPTEEPVAASAPDTWRPHIAAAEPGEAVHPI